MKNLLKQNRISCIVLVGFLFVFSCKKDPPIQNKGIDNSYNFPPYTPDPCITIPPSHNVNGYNIKYPDYGYGWPDYNPKNSNEFVCVQSNASDTASSPIQSLISFNVETGFKTVIYKGDIMNQPKWGSQGWIVFTSWPDQQLWKIKSDGTSLTQITYDADCKHDFADWNPDGNKIVFDFTKANGSFNSRIIDINGNLVKDLDTSFGGNSIWLADGISIAGINHGQPHIINLNTGAITKIPYFGWRWFPDQKSWLTSNSSGLFVYRSAINTLQKIRNNCQNNQYNFFSISNDGTKILADRTFRKLLDSLTILQEQDIVIMNANGSGEQVINIK
jgi:hypothetical protein